MKIPGIRVRLDFGPDRALGPGKIALLEAIERTGSLSQAARDLGMSYRRGWLLLHSTNSLLTEPVSVATTGGAGGGGVELTATGKALIKAFRQLEKTVMRNAGKNFGAFTLAHHEPERDSAPVKRVPLDRRARKKPGR
jgi:molybdate transport system regulatory protein